MSSPSTPRSITWSMRTQNLYGTVPAVWGWALLFFGLFGVWFQKLPPATPAGWIPVGLAALGGLLVLWGLATGLRRNRLLATGVIAPGRLVNLTPSGMRVNGIPQVQVTYAFQHDGADHRVTAAVPVSPRLGVQALDAMAAALGDIVRAQADTGGAGPHPLVQEFVTLQPMDLLRRIMDEGWDAVVKGYAVRAAAVTAITAAGDAVERPTAALTGQPPSAALGTLADQLVNAAHANLASHIGAEHWAGKVAHSLLNGVRDFAGDQARALFAPTAELIFYPPQAPDAALPAAALGYRLERADDGRLRGGNLLIALAVSILPTLTLLVHGSIALVRFWPR